MLVNKPLRSGIVRRGRRWNGCRCSSSSCQTWKISETHSKEAQRNYWLKEYHARVSTFAKCHKSFQINWHATHGTDYVRLIQPFHDRWDVLLLKVQVPLVLLNDTHFCETRTHHTTSTTKCTLYSMSESTLDRLPWDMSSCWISSSTASSSYSFITFSIFIEAKKRSSVISCMREDYDYAQ